MASTTTFKLRHKILKSQKSLLAGGNHQGLNGQGPLKGKFFFQPSLTHFFVLLFLFSFRLKWAVLAKPEFYFMYVFVLVWTLFFCSLCANCLALVFLIGFNGNFLGHCICTFHLGFRSKIFFMENRGKNNEHWRLLSWDFYLRQQKFVNTCTTSAIWSRSNHHLLSLYVKNNSLIKDYDLNDVGFV